jgi:large subunit ribosomal protein L4
VSADDIKNTPDVEAAAAPEQDEGQAASEVKKPAAEKPAAETVAAEKVAAEKPAAKKAVAEKATTKSAPKKTAAKAAKSAAKKPAAKPASKRAAAAKPVEKVPVVRPPKVKVEKKAPPEPRHGKLGVATLVDATGKELETRDLSKHVFGVPADVNTLHLVVRAEQAARRSGTASSKTRGEVSGSTAKLYRQKGTGRARAGSVKSPLRTGGGVTFGPRPRSFAFKVNRKVVRQALAMALSNRAENGNVFVAAGLQIEVPSTATMDAFLVNLDIAAPVLVVTHDEPTVTKSVRNLRYAETSEVGALSTERVLRARSLVLTEKAFAALNEA